MDKNKFPHQRERKDLTTEAITSWNGAPLTGCYLVKNTLSAHKEKQNCQPVILFPGGFDPFQGSFSSKAIRKLLAKPNISAVYEAHYFSEERAGYLDPETYIADLKNIYTSEGKKPILAGMSASTFMLMSALYQLKQENAILNVEKTLLIGPFLPDYRSFLGRNLRHYYNRKSMRDKIIHHCGHVHVFENGVRMRAWWASNAAFRQAVKKKEFHQLAGSLNTQLDALFFQIDTLSIKGKRRLKKQFGTSIIKEKISKHHRSLLFIPEFDKMLTEYCGNATAPVASIRTLNKPQQTEVSLV